MTTNEAITDILNKPFKECGIPDIKENTFRSYQKRFRDGKLPIEKMDEILEKSGYVVIQEKEWAKL